jgi:hypothetical protein
LKEGKVYFVNYTHKTLQIMAGPLDAVSGALGLTPLGMGLGAVSMAGQIFGAVKAAKEQKKNQALLNTQVEQNQADYNNEANKSFLDTNVAKDAVRQANENLVDDRKAVAGRAAITGASDEANVAGQSNVTKNYNDSVSRIASLGTNYQDRAKSRFQANRMALQQQQAALNQQKADGAANLAGNAGDLLGTVTMGAGMNSPKAGVYGGGRESVSKIPTIKTPNHVSLGGERQFVQKDKLIGL